MRQWKRTAVLAALLAVPFAVVGQDADEESPCAMCHDDVAARMETTPHGLGSGELPECQSCHGDGIAHMDEGGDPELILVPTGAMGQDTCLRCHEAAMHRTLRTRGAHTTARVYCTDCHQIHPGDEPGPQEASLLQGPVNELCVDCHQMVARTFDRPFGHNLDRGGVDCVSCHDPHAGPGERSLRLDHSGEGPCVTCHPGKRGPFVFPHVSGIVGGCTTCHEPHGSSNPVALVRATVSQLCLECHSSFGNPTLGSQPPSFHNLRDPRYRECTSCHPAVHGSNTSPALRR